MIYPVFGIWHTIESSRLYENGFVGWIEVDVANSSSVARDRVRDVHTGKVWRYDEIDVLARVWEESKHAKGKEASHSPGIIISWETSGRWAKEGRDVKVGSLCREGRATSIVVLEHGEERRLISYVGDILVVEVVEAAHKAFGAPVEGDECCLIVGNETAQISVLYRDLESREKHNTYKPYSHRLLSKVSLPVFCSEQAIPELSMLLHVSGSWTSHVWFRNLGWKKPTNDVSTGPFDVLRKDV